MTKKLALLTIILTILILFSAACTNSTAQTVNPDDAELPPAAVLKAQEQLGEELNVTTAEISIVNQEKAEWSDSCLGLGGIAESCLLVVVPGWLIEFSVNGQTYTAHTDELGEQIRFENLP